jgi:hypothetical protein
MEAPMVPAPAMATVLISLIVLLLAILSIIFSDFFELTHIHRKGRANCSNNFQKSLQPVDFSRKKYFTLTFYTLAK